MTLTLHCQMMKTRAVFHISLMFVALLTPVTAKAQECGVNQAEIVTLREAIFREPVIWDTEYGEDSGLEQIVDLVSAHKEDEVDDETFIVIGHYTNDGNDTVLKPFVANLDKRGDLIWENRGKSSIMKTPVKIIKTNSGYAVLGNLQDPKSGNGFYISHFNKAGKRTQYHPHFWKNKNIKASGFALTKDKRGFVVAAERVVTRGGGPQEAMMYRINMDGSEAWHRIYNPGVKTLFRDITLLPNDRYALTGEIEQEDGRTAGWLLTMGEDGKMGWQKQYPRGSGSSIYKIIALEDGSMLVIGDVAPFGGKTTSAWIMKVHPNGAMIWQRHFTGEYRFNTKDILLEEDGRILILLDVFPVKESKKSIGRTKRGHTRILTLSTRGELLNMESFTAGAHAHAVSMVFGENFERVVAGTVQAAKPKKEEGEEEKEKKDINLSLFNGWLFATPSLDVYVDPCQ